MSFNIWWRNDSTGICRRANASLLITLSEPKQVWTSLMTCISQEMTLRLLRGYIQWDAQQLTLWTGRAILIGKRYLLCLQRSKISWTTLSRGFLPKIVRQARDASFRSKEWHPRELQENGLMKTQVKRLNLSVKRRQIASNFRLQTKSYMIRTIWAEWPAAQPKEALPRNQLRVKSCLVAIKSCTARLTTVCLRHRRSVKERVMIRVQWHMWQNRAR